VTESGVWNRLGKRASQLAHRYASSGVPAGSSVVSCMGYLVPVRTAAAPAAAPVELDADDLLTWARSGDLTWGEAEGLLALERTTAWDYRA
jgi:hypothetical protein